jgi:hypothetical protein
VERHDEGTERHGEDADVVAEGVGLVGEGVVFGSRDVGDGDPLGPTVVEAPTVTATSPPWPSSVPLTRRLSRRFTRQTSCSHRR